MKKLLIIILAAIIAVSCTDKYQSNLNMMGASVKQFIEDNAFKENGKVVFYDFSAISYDTIPSLYIDTLNSIKLSEKLEKLEQYQEALSELVRKETDLMKLYGSLGMGELTEMKRGDALENIEKMKKIVAMKGEIYDEDSIVRAKLANTKESEDIYRLTAFIKATFYVGNDSVNNMDTLHYFFNKELEMIRPHDYSRFDLSNID